jgi:hypothetical protein
MPWATKGKNLLRSPLYNLNYFEEIGVDRSEIASIVHTYIVGKQLLGDYRIFLCYISLEVSVNSSHT